jgi:osmotically-inducible protein OsmY
MTHRTSNRIHVFMAAAALAGAVVASTTVDAQSVATKDTAYRLQRALERLTNYGVFDYLAFSLDRGTVTLMGYAYTSTLKADAERTVKRVAGVDEVANQIELLPPSLNDDRIRRATFYRIYTDSSLSRYAAGGEHAVFHDSLEFGRYPGLQPFGDYPIHIIVNWGHTRLLGVVDNAGDKQIAGFRAREVDGVFSVQNELVLASGTR